MKARFGHAMIISTICLREACILYTLIMKAKSKSVVEFNKSQ